MPDKAEDSAEPSQGRVTLQTIADRLGVSRTTVSNAYNRPDQLNPELRERVLQTARRLGYAGPDPAARRLRSGGREAIGLLFTEHLSYAFTDPAAVTFIQGLTTATESAGLSLLLLPSAPHAEPQAVREAVVDSFCVYSVYDGDPGVQAAIERRLPVVIVDEPRRPDAAFVGIDDRGGARLAGEHLVELGHRRIAMICDTLSEGHHMGPVDSAREAEATYFVERERLAGYREALEGAGLDWGAVPKFEAGGSHRARGAEAAETLLASRPRPTALIVLSDQLALGALQAASRLGIDVPGELSIIGYDDIPAAADAGLTTVRQPLLEKGAAAARLLREGAQPGEEILLPIELVARGTTGPA
jgi:DNA-binding LacI/PurR family transcriptional regulator